MGVQGPQWGDNQLREDNWVGSSGIVLDIRSNNIRLRKLKLMVRHSVLLTTSLHALPSGSISLQSITAWDAKLKWEGKFVCLLIPLTGAGIEGFGVFVFQYAFSGGFSSTLLVTIPLGLLGHIT